MKILINKDELTGREVNPYYCESLSAYTCYELPEASICKGCQNHTDFESTVQSYPLTERCEGGSIVDASLVWQYRTNNDMVVTGKHKELIWATLNNTLFLPEANPDMCRQAYLIQPIEQVKHFEFEKTDEGEVIGYVSFKNGDLHIEPAIANVEQVKEETPMPKFVNTDYLSAEEMLKSHNLLTHPDGRYIRKNTYCESVASVMRLYAAQTTNDYAIKLIKERIAELCELEEINERHNREFVLPIVTELNHILKKLQP